MIGAGLVALLIAACSGDDGGTGSDSAGSDTNASPEERDQVVPQGLSMEGTGPSPEGAGLLSQDAVDQASCSGDGQTNSSFAGGGPYCVNPWPEGSDNGGETAPGVTATEVQVIGYIPADAENAGGSEAPVNRATGEPATIDDALADLLEVYDYLTNEVGTFQLWGRTPKIEFVEASGEDETAQRADALEVIDKRPFMVVDLTRTSSGGAPVFSAAVAAEDIVVVSSSTSSTTGAEQSPYRWSYASDQDAGPALTAAFLGKTLAGGTARYAGDDALTEETRAFGVVYPSSDFDLGAFEDTMKDNGGPEMTDAVEFDPTAAAQITEQAPTMVNHLKAAGVTSVVLFGDFGVVRALMAAATDQDYHPEWIITGFGFHELSMFARTFDQDQMRHTFGLSALFPYFVTPPEYSYLTAYDWYWGTDQGNYWGISGGLADFVYRAMHYAGPTLTAENLKKGLFSVPATGGAATGIVTWQSGYGNTVGLPFEEYAQLGSDRALAWWNADATGPSQATGVPGQGVFMYLDGGLRYGYGGFPDEEPTFFDEATAIDTVDVTSLFEGGVPPAPTPCPGCPSSE